MKSQVLFLTTIISTLCLGVNTPPATPHPVTPPQSYFVPIAFEAPCAPQQGPVKTPKTGQVFAMPDPVEEMEELFLTPAATPAPTPIASTPVAPSPYTLSAAATVGNTPVAPSPNTVLFLLQPQPAETAD